MAKARIMVVEDESIVALDLQNRLQRLGYEIVATASSGEMAVHQALETRPDLVLMDIKLKGEMDGIAAATAIRGQLDVPVIYLTAFADEATLQRAKITTPYGYLLKPFQERELHTTIAMSLYRHEMERRLRDKEQWLNTTLRSIGDGVIATDTEGDIQFMNEVASRLTGWRAAEALGQNIRDVFRLVRQKRQPLLGQSMTQMFKQRVVAEATTQTMLVTRQGGSTPIEQTVNPIKDENGRTQGFVLVFRDIQDRQQAEETIRQYTMELLAQNKELDAFAHTVAHDLRSPLAPLLGLTEVLESALDGMPEEEILTYLQAIRKSGRKMLSIIDELLTLSQVRKADVATRPLDMGSIVVEAQERLAHMIEESGAVISSPENWPVAVGYAPWVEEVWVNYLSNALKYGGRPPQIEVGASAQNDGAVRFWVRDNGPGLTPEQQAQLFTPFTRLHQVRAKGSGLGLSIVQRIASKLDGEVGIESKVGLGSTFSFTLPAAVPSRELDRRLLKDSLRSLNSAVA